MSKLLSHTIATLSACCTLLFFSTILHAQNPDFAFAKRMGGISEDKANDVAVDASGNIYTTGTFRSTADFNPGPGVFNLKLSGGTTNAFISKVDASGNFIWAKQLSGSTCNGRAIAVDCAGNVYVAGSVNGAVDLDPGAGQFLTPNIETAFILKLDTGGNFVWAKLISKPTSQSGLCTMNAIAVDADENVYTTGVLDGTIDFDPGANTFLRTSNGGYDVFILKLDASGNLSWAKSMGAPGLGSLGDDWGEGIAINNSTGTVYITGDFDLSSDFDPGAGVFTLSTNTPTLSNFDVFVLALNASGDFLWAKSMGSTIPGGARSDDWASSITVDKLTGDLCLTGGYQGQADFDPGAGVFNLTAVSGLDMYIWKLTANGNFVWAKSIDANGRSNFVAIDNRSNVYAGGSFGGTVDFDPGTGVSNLTSAGAADMFIVELTSNGNFSWGRQMGGINSLENLVGLGLDARMNLYSAGSFSGPAVNFDPGKKDSSISSYSGGYDVFLYKLQRPFRTFADDSICNGDTLQYDLENPLYHLSVLAGDTLSVSCSACQYPFVKPRITSTYIVMGPCNSMLDTFTINVTDYPSFYLGADTSLCNESLQLSIPAENGNITWWDGSNGHSFLAEKTGSYWATISLNGCATSDTILVTIKSPPTQNLGVDVVVCDDIPMEVSLQANVPAGATVLWSDGSMSSSVTATHAGTWWVHVEDAPCADNDTMIISTESCGCIFNIPTAFSPNDDGLNDVFRPVIQQGCPNVRYLAFHIYNRYGQQVFTSTGSPQGWDGNYNGVPQEIGVYFYELRIEGGKHIATFYRKGEVTLIR